VSDRLAGLSALQIVREYGVVPSAPQAAALKVFGGRGERLDDAEMAAWSWLANVPPGTPPPAGAPRMCLGILGRQCGKTDIITAPLILQAALDPRLFRIGLPGQRFTIPVVAPVVDRTTKILDAVRRLLLPLGIAFEERAGEFRLRDFPIDIVATTMSITSASSLTAPLVVGEDMCLATTLEGSPRQDDAIITALMAMGVTVPFFRMVSLSQAHARAGWQHEMVEEFWGKPSIRAVAIKGATFDVYPPVTRERCMELAGRDLKKFRRVYCGEPGQNNESLFERDDIQSNRVEGRFVLARVPGVAYAAAADLAWRRDYTALALGHAEERRLPDGTSRVVFVIDKIRVWKPRPGQPLDPELTIGEIALECRGYGIREIGIDQFSEDIASSRFLHHGLRTAHIKTDLASQAKRAEGLMSKLRSRTIELLDDKETNEELERLQLQYRSRGAISFAAPARKGSHDDRADALLALVERLQAAPAFAVGVRSELTITNDERGFDFSTRWFDEKTGRTVAPPKGTPQFDEYAKRLILQGVVDSPEINAWIEERLGPPPVIPGIVIPIGADPKALPRAHDADAIRALASDGPWVPVREF
jgi:hypothetical protein